MSSILHSQFLVHWTGGGKGDFHQSHGPLNDGIRSQYVDRLADDLQSGFYMNRGKEKIWGVNNENITSRIARVCFTEIKLSMVRRHANLYGSLGIGVTRDYVLERYGGPVFYVQNGKKSNVVENFHKISSFLVGKPIEGEFATLMGYVKNMSKKDHKKLIYYDEMEWRVVHLRRLDGRYVTPQDPSRLIYRLKLEPADVKVIVFPDLKTKRMALRRPAIRSRVVSPICVTLDDCDNF